MSQAILQARRLASLEVVSSLPARRVLAVGTFALLTALGAFVTVPLPGTPVPVSLQALFVLLSGVLLGPRLGAASQTAYLAAGIAGLPVFAGGGAGPLWLLGPTGGYLLAFPVAAYLTGRLAGSAAAGAPRLAAGLVAGVAVIYAGGAAQLALLTGDGARAVQLGVVPFLLGDLLKLAVALLVARRLRARTLGLV